MADTEQLEIVVREQAEQLEELRAEVRSLQRRLDADAVGAGPGRPVVERCDLHRPGLPATGERVADRRELLRRAGVVAAGAAAGGAALLLGSAEPASAATGTFSGNPAVIATGVGGWAVQATSDTGSAVYATNDNDYPAVGAYNYGTGYALRGDAKSVGVFGYASDLQGAGVMGATLQGYGLRARTIATTAKAHLYLENYGEAVPPPKTRTDYHNAGEIVADVNHDLWYCAVAGNPGVWRELAGWGTAGSLVVLGAPIRVYDSRPNFAPAIGPKTPLADGVARTIDLKGNGANLPAGSTAVLLSLTATGTTGAAGGFLSVYRNGIAWPGTSNLNWSGPGQNIAVTTLTGVDNTVRCALYANVATDVVVDVIGFYQ